MSPAMQLRAAILLGSIQFDNPVSSPALLVCSRATELLAYRTQLGQQAEGTPGSGFEPQGLA